eukprot:COSAG01_NODE_22200_length_867_cov_1.398438_1_plen_49_part_10
MPHLFLPRNIEGGENDSFDDTTHAWVRDQHRPTRHALSDHEMSRPAFPL